MVSRSKIQTQKLAAKLAKKIISKGTGKHAKILALTGDLGSGKTAFTQGFAKALGIKHRIPSPTFVIFRRYPILSKNNTPAGGQRFFNIYHFDWYRMNDAKDILMLGFKEIIGKPQNIVIIEWPERAKKIIPKNAIWIYFSHRKKLNERKIILSLPKDKFRA